ncbi:hypothetical protein Leryth_003916 [Lithospermum erythrorhizon]|nr:hypothetical protein Leryth_003916 [Lithospermum erythrorhizon]
MKRAAPWSDGDDDSSTSSSSDEYSDTDHKSTDQGESATKRKGKGIDFEALSRHGYKGGLSVLKVPPPKIDEKQDWSWSKGKETRVQEKEETYEDRQRTRAALVEGEQLLNVRTQKEKKIASFSQKEKKKESWAS